MAVTFKRTDQGFTNVWTQLKDIVSTKSLYNSSDYESFTSAQKERYLTMLYQNNDALAQRLPEEYNSEYGDAETRFALLSATNAKYQFNLNWQDPEYQKSINEQIDKQLDAQLSQDVNKDKSWVDWMVENKYDGSYAKFVADYSGENAKTYQDALVEMVPEEYELTEETFATGIANVSDVRESLYTAAKSSQSDAYSETLKYVREKLKSTAEKEAYENASALEKVANTLWQIPTLMATETVEIVEGLGDLLIAAAGAVSAIFGTETAWAETAIKYDWWAPETWLGVETSASYLNRYADDNAAKWIHEIGINIVDMVPLAIPGVGQAIYYASAAGKTMEAELNSGYSFGEAFTHTLGSTAIEFTTEKISGSKFFGGGIFKKWERLGGKNLGWKLFHDTVGEGLEEVISEVGSDIWHGVVTGEFQLLGQKDAWAQLSKTFAIGGLVGGIMTGSNAALQSHIISKSAVTLSNKTGKSFSLSPAKAAIIQDFVQRTGKKIEAGGTVSEATRRKFDVLKNFKIRNTDIFDQIVKRLDKQERSGKDITIGELSRVIPTKVEATIKKDYYDKTVGPKIRRKIRLLELVRGSKAGVPEETTKKSFAEEAAAIRADAEAKPGTDNSTYEFIESTGLDKNSLASVIAEALDAETKEQTQKDFVVSGAMGLGKLMKMFGQDASTEGLNLWEQYANKTINEAMELAQIGTENSAFVKADGDSSPLNKHFANAEFMLVKTKANTAINDKYTEVYNSIKTLKKSLKNFKTTDIKLFFTTGATVSTSFFIDNTLYINGAWLAETDTGRVKDIIISKYCVEDARRIMNAADKYKTVRNLLYETMTKIDNPNRSVSVMLQELAYIMFFQENNILLKQILSYAPDKSGVNAVIDYFDTLRRTYGNTSVQKAVGKGLTNMLVTVEEMYDTGNEPKTDIVLPADRTESVKDIIDVYQNMNFRAFPFITGKNGIPTNAAKVQAMYLHMKNTYGFNKALDLTKKINWIKQFTDAKNFDGDGYARLTTELNKFQNVKTSTGYTRSTVPANKTLSELLNYYLDVTCGLMVFSNGTITESEMTTQVLNMDNLSLKAEELAQKTDAPRDSIGTVADFLTLPARGRLLPKFQNIPIYVTFDTTSASTASIIGDTNTGMAIVINLSNAAKLQKDTVTAGGMTLALDENGELIKNTDGSFKVRDNTKHISKLAYVIGHEIGHSIGMMLGFNGTFSETDIAKAYASKLHRMTYSERVKIIDSIKAFLMTDNDVKPEMRNFARRLGLSDAVIAASPDQADAKISEYVDSLYAAMKFESSSVPKEYRQQITALSGKFEALATHLYYTGFANEMFADGKAESVAREDIIHSRSHQVNQMSTTVIETHSDLAFIELLNGSAFTLDVDTAFLETFDIDSPENSARRIFTGMSSISDVAKELGVEFNYQLISPDFWNNKIKKTTDATRTNLISAFEDYCDCTYDSINKEFMAGSVSKLIRDTYSNTPKINESFSAVILNDGKVINTKNHTAYNDGSQIRASIMYQPATGNRRANLTIQLNDEMPVYHDKSTGVFSIGNVSLPIPPHTTATLIAGGKVFRNLKAAKQYLNTQPVISKNTDFESVFNRVIEQADSVGRQFKYQSDTIYMTADGKIYNLDINMADWNGYANLIFGNDASKAENLFGQYTEDSSGNFITENPENIAYALSRLLDDKQIVRFYRSGESWVAYGTPNRLQDDLINELGAERKNITGYTEIESDRKLFVTLEGNMPKVVIRSNNWSSAGYHEVDWKRNNWYTTVCQIMTKYGIVKLQDFELLGFSQDFINKLKSGKNLGEKVFYDYLRDDTNTDYSRNILIENCPRPNRESGSGDWKNNPHIHNLAEAKEYWNLATTLVDIMPVNASKDGSEAPVIFNTIAELKLALEKASKDPINKPMIEAAVEQREAYLKILGSDIYIQLLNKDSNTGLRLDKNSFTQAIGYIRKYAENYAERRSTKREVSLEIEDDSDESTHTMIRPGAESTELPAAFKKVDESGPRDKIYVGYMTEIKDISKIDDVTERNSAYEELLDTLKLERYANYEYRDLIENVILNKLEGTSLDQYRRSKLESTRKRIEKYKELSENSPEQLQERRKLIRYYEQLSNQKLKIISDDNKDYYNAMLKIVGEIGTYSKRMNEAFAHQYKKANKLRERIINKEAFDSAIDKFREMRNALLQVDMEYYGWYSNYESLLQLFKDYLNGNKMSQNKTLAAVRTDIINFINGYETAVEFRQQIAEREKVSDYIFANNVRGASLFEADLERFKNIPEEIKDINSFPKEARKFYNVYKTGKKSAEALNKFLNNPEGVEALLRVYGQDFIYNLKKLYNELITPIPGSGISQKKRDLLAKALEIAEMDEETTAAIEADLAPQKYREVAKEAYKQKREDYIDYRKLAIENAGREYKFLAEGKPVDDGTRKQALQNAAEVINDYRWPVTRNYHAIRLDLRGMSEKRKQDIITSLSAVDTRRKSNAVYVDKDAAGNIEYAEFLSKYSPDSAPPHQSDIRSIKLSGKTNAAKKQKNALGLPIYQNKYYENRSVVSHIINDHSRVSYEDNEINGIKYRDMFIDTTGLSERELDSFKQRVAKITQKPLNDKDIKKLGGILITAKLDPENLTAMPVLLNSVRNVFEPTELTRISDTTRGILTIKDIYNLSESQKYRITHAIMHAYYEFMSNPKTNRSIDKFKNDIGVALEYGATDKIIRGGKRERVSIQVPIEYKEPWWEPEKTVNVDEILKPLLNTQLKEEVNNYQELLDKFRAETIFDEQAIDAKAAEYAPTESEAEKLRQKRVAWDKRRVRERGITVVQAGEPYNVKFNSETGKFETTEDAHELSEDSVDFRLLSHDVIKDYLTYNVDKGLEEGWLKKSRAGNIIDPDTNKIVMYGEGGPAIYTPVSEDDFVFEDSEIAEDSEMVSEDDFVFDESIDSSGVSNYIEDDMEFDAIEFEEAPVKEAEPKGTWEEVKPEKRYYQVKSGLSANTAKMLDYQPRKWEDDGSFSSAEFLEDNAEYLTKFTSNEREMEAFVSRIESNPSIPINSPQEAIIFALLNKVYNRTAITGNTDLHNRADILVKQLSARAGRILGMIKKYGVTPAEQLATLCSKLLDLSEDEKQLLADVTTVQENAIANYNYTRANEAMEAVLDILRKHKDELPTSMNVFAKGLTAEERTARWTNIANNISSWKYFAMLGTPTTFFTKNIASNVLITGMDAAAENIAKLFQRGKTLSDNYSFTDTQFDGILSGDKRSLTTNDVSTIVRHTVKNTTDIKQIDISKLTADLNAFITTRYKTDGKMPSASRIAGRANEWLRKRFYQYKMNKSANETVKSIVKANLKDNGLLAGIMSDQNAKYDRGYDVKIGKLRNIVLNEKTKLEDLSEADASVLANAVKKDAPFGNDPNNVLNRYYRFIFKTMELGDKKFIEPKIIKIVEKLVASNMTEAEMIALQNGDKTARTKFNEFVQYAVDDAMKTYFRGNSEFQQKIMRLFNGHPIAQIIFGTIMPFPRMVLNTMSTALSYSPVGFIKAIYIASTSQDAFTELKVSKELGKAITGSTLIAIGAALAAAGILDFDDDDEYAGVQLIIGGKIRVSLSDLAPAALPMVIGATMTNGFTEGFWNGVYVGGDALLDATLLGEAIEIFGGNKNSADVVTDTFSSFVNQFMPSMFRHMARTIDPTQKKYSSNKGAKIIQRIAAAIPGISLLVPSKVDPYTGDAVYQNAGASKGWAHILSFVNAFSPAKITIDVESDVEEESKAVGAATTGPAKTYKINGVEYTMPDELYRDYQILRAKLYSQYAQSIINTSAYKNMSIEKKRLKLKSLQTKATEEARKQLNIGK